MPVRLPIPKTYLMMAVKSASESHSVTSDSLWPHSHRNLQVRILEWVAIPFSRASSQTIDQTQVSRITGDSLPAEPPKKPKNTGEGSLTLLQQIFLTQESNQGLLHRRWILYQLSHMGMMAVTTSKFHEEVLKMGV